MLKGGSEGQLVGSYCQSSLKVALAQLDTIEMLFSIETCALGSLAKQELN